MGHSGQMTVGMEAVLAGLFLLSLVPYAWGITVTWRDMRADERYVSEARRRRDESGEAAN